jgi:hypothetical protein
LTIKENLRIDELKKLKDKFRKEANQYVDSWNEKIRDHRKKLRSETNYAMEVMKNEMCRLVQREYEIKD